jgi:hypothetical protein
MQAGFLTKAALAAALVLVPAACAQMGGDGSGFRNQYMVARAALEEGNYPRANRAYKRLLADAGPFEPRVRLEYAHSLLRGGDYQAASDEARTLAATQDGDARSAALAVLGTAQHELAIAAIQRGDRAGAGQYHLTVARDALAEVLANHPDLDPLGALAGRQRSIEAALKA